MGDKIFDSIKSFTENSHSNKKRYAIYNQTIFLTFKSMNSYCK